MTLGTVTVMGLRDDVTRVFLGMIEIASSNYTQDSATKTVILDQLHHTNQAFIYAFIQPLHNIPTHTKSFFLFFLPLCPSKRGGVEISFILLFSEVASDTPVTTVTAVCPY